MAIRRMRAQDLEAVLGWAADEGWNPGHDDAAPFYTADPDGFFVKEVGGRPLAAISVVNHDSHFAFLGLYICRPAFRGQGHGLDVWRAGIAHAGSRCIGLDGVPDQQANYARSGFVKQGSTVRLEGQIAARPDPRLRAATSADTEELVARDRTVSGMDRGAFSRAWVAPSETRRTVVLDAPGGIVGFAVHRLCRVGRKVGPLYANFEVDALALLGADPWAMPSAPVFVDVPGKDTPLARALDALGFAPVFETARMFTGRAPKTVAPPFHAIASMELG